MGKIRVLIVDDHPIVRAGFKLIMDTEPTIEIVGEALDGRSAVQLAKQLQPDIVLIDLMLPGKDGITTIHTIKSDNPGIRVIVITTFADEDKITAATNVGVDGYLLKDADGKTLLPAIYLRPRMDTTIQ